MLVDPTDPNNHVLSLVATGVTEHMHNHAETTLADGANIISGQEYRISFRAKWISGSNQLNTRLYLNPPPTAIIVTAAHSSPLTE